MSWKTEGFLPFFKNPRSLCVFVKRKFPTLWLQCTYTKGSSKPLVRYTPGIKCWILIFCKLLSSLSQAPLPVPVISHGLIDNVRVPLITFPAHYFCDLLICWSQLRVAESTYHWLRKSNQYTVFCGNEKFGPWIAFMWQASPKACENCMCQQLTGLGMHVATTGLGLLQVKVHPEVLSKDGVKQLCFKSCCENISNIPMFVTVFTGWWKYICQTYQSAAEDNSFLCTSHISHHSWWLLRGCLVINHVLCLWLSGHRSCIHWAECCTNKTQKSYF